jgi:hypothetical protein
MAKPKTYEKTVVVKAFSKNKLEILEGQFEGGHVMFKRWAMIIYTTIWLQRESIPVI